MRNKLKLFSLIFLLMFIFTAFAFSKDILKIGFQDDIKTLNAFRANDVWSKNVLNTIYEGLYVYSPQTYKITPWLADGQPKINEQDNTAVVKLRKDITWSDGKPFTSKDVVFTANVCIKYKLPQLKGNWEFIEEVTAKGDYAVEFKFKEMRATFLHGTLMQFIKPEHIWRHIIDSAVSGKESIKQSRIAILNINPTETETIGTGPFVIKEWNNNQFISLNANEDYHMEGKRIQGAGSQYRIGPNVDGLLFRIYASTDSAIDALKRGDIDYIWWEILPDKLTQLKKDSNIKISENPQNSLFYLSFNTRRRPFKYKEFRQAMSWLIDRNYIKDRILKGYGEALTSIVPPGNKIFYNGNTEDYGTSEKMSRKQRENKAKEILKKGGFSWDNDGILKDPSGKKLYPFTIKVPTADYDPIRSLSAFIISEWWQALGVPVTVEPVSFGDLLDKVFVERDFDAFILGWDLSVFPDYLRNFFHSSQDEPAGSNPAGFKSVSFDRVSTEFIKELDISKQVAKAKELQKIIADECVYIPLYATASIEAYSTRFEGWVSQLNGIGNIWSLLFVKAVK